MLAIEPTAPETDAATPTNPPILSDEDHDALMSEYIRARSTFAGLAEAFHLSPAQLARWVHSQRTQEELALILAAIEQREKLLAAQARVSAFSVLDALAGARGNLGHTGDPVSPIEQRTWDSARKAATTTLRNSQPQRTPRVSKGRTTPLTPYEPEARARPGAGTSSPPPVPPGEVAESARPEGVRLACLAV